MRTTTLRFRTFGFAAAFAIATLTSMLIPTVARADTTPVTCTPDTTQSGGTVTCTGGSTGTGGTSGVDTSWLPVNATGPACVDSFGNPSYRTPLVQIGTGIIDSGPPLPCVIQTGMLQNGQTTKDKAKALVKMPKPQADFSGDFLTGAPVHFTIGKQQVVTANVPNVPGAYLDATPKSFTWDFGDGKTATGTDTTHTYQSTTVNPAAPSSAVSLPNNDNAQTDNSDTSPCKPTNHAVCIVVTGTWHLYFHGPAADPSVQDLGEVELQATLLDANGNPNPRTIVQVWSAQTEPNS